MASSSISSDILNVVSQYSFYTGCVISTGGLIGNAVNILVFTNIKFFRANRSALYLTGESIANFVFQFLFIVLTTLTAIYGDDATGRSLVWCRLRYIWSQTCVLISFSMICCAACDQFFSTNYRLNLRQMCTLKLARYLTFVALCIWLVHSILFGLSFSIQTSFGCVISNSIWSRYASFWLYPILEGLLPVVVASSFSFLAFYNVRHIIRRQVPIARRQLDRQMTAMVLMRVVSFVILVLPYTIYRIYVINFPVSQVNLLQYAIVRLLQAISFSFASVNYTVKSLYLIHVVDSDLF
jgi:hypothetical protein